MSVVSNTIVGLVTLNIDGSLNVRNQRSLSYYEYRVDSGYSMALVKCFVSMGIKPMVSVQS